MNQLIQRLLSFCKTSRCNETITVNDKPDRGPSFLTTGATYRGNEKKKEMSKPEVHCPPSQRSMMYWNVM